MSKRLPQRIACLTTETVEVLYALGEQERIVGISSYTVFPKEARKEKPKVFAFTSGDLKKAQAIAKALYPAMTNLESGKFVFSPRPQRMPELMVQIAAEMDRAHPQAGRVASLFASWMPKNSERIMFLASGLVTHAAK